MNQRIVRIAPWSAARIFGIMYFVMGLVFLPFFALPGMLGGGEAVRLGMGLAIALPVLYGVIGFLGTAFFAWLYNVIAGWVGGIELEMIAGSDEDEEYDDDPGF